MNMSAKEIDNHLYRGKKRLRKILEEKNSHTRWKYMNNKKEQQHPLEELSSEQLDDFLKYEKPFTGEN